MLQYWSDLRPFLTQRSSRVVVYNGGSDRARVASTTAMMINVVHYNCLDLCAQRRPATPPSGAQSRGRQEGAGITRCSWTLLFLIFLSLSVLTVTQPIWIKDHEKSHLIRPATCPPPTPDVCSLDLAFMPGYLLSGKKSHILSNFQQWGGHTHSYINTGVYVCVWGPQRQQQMVTEVLKTRLCLTTCQ